jgi:hypothetical protein
MVKNFLPDTITLGDLSTLTFTIHNPNLALALNGLGFTDTYPSGLVNATPLNTTNSCGGSLTASAGGNSIILYDGTITANSDCTVTVRVTSSTPNTYLNTSGAVSSTEGGPGNTASDTLTVNKFSPTISTTLSATSIPVGGSVHDGATLNGATSNAGGSVTYTVYSNSTCTLNAQAAGTVTVTNGSVPNSNSIGFNNAGTYYWQAVYSGDANNLGATSTCVSEQLTVNKASPTMTTTASGSVAVGGNITDTAHLNGGFGTLSGTITFDVYAPGDTTCATPLTAPTGNTVSGSGDYTSGNFITTTFGIYRWKAHYSGDANNNAVNTACNDAGESSTVVAIDAVNDSGTAVDTVLGGTSIANVLVNDTLNGAAATTSNVTITAMGTWPSGITLNTSTGAVSVAPGTAVGTYTPQYQICDKANPSICDIATVAVPVEDLAKNFGHLPSSYTGMNLLADGGAVHLTGDTYLGATVTTAADGINTETYTPKASDDGVTWTPGVAWSNSGGGSVDVIVHCPSAPCYLNAWLDWNKDSDFNDTGEQIFTNRQVVNGLNTLTFPIPSGAVLDGSTFYSRFRIYPIQPTNPLPNGSALSGTTPLVGEIEDPLFQIKDGSVPTPVTLSYFLAQRQGSSVVFEWSTATETGNIGFKLYVNDGGKLILINTELIPSQGVDSLDRQDYSYTADVKGTIFYIEDVSMMGETRMHGTFQLGQEYGARLDADKIDWAVVQVEHDNKYDQQQAKLDQFLKVPQAAFQGNSPTAAPRPTRAVAPAATPRPLLTLAPTAYPRSTRTAAPTRTPTPTKVFTPTKTTRPTKTVVPTASATPTATPTSTVTPTATLVPTGTVLPTATVNPTATPVPTETAEPTPTLEPIATPTYTIEPTATGDVVVVPTETVEPTATNTPTPTPVPWATAVPVDPAGLQLTTTFNIKVRQTGLYRVSYETLLDAGLDLAGVPVARITVINRNMIVPVYVYMPDQVENFGPGGFIEFYGEALDTIYTDTNIYTVQVTTATVSRIPGVSAQPGLDLVSPAAYTNTLVVNNQRLYANYAPGEDAWYDTEMLVYKSPKSWSFPFQVNGLADSSADASLELVVWGVTDWPQSPDHHLKVSLNGIPLADETFDGLIEKTIKVSLPAGTLQEGANTLKLTLPGDTGVEVELVALDKFSVSYQRLFQARDGRLTFTAAGGVFQVTNLPGANVIVYRMRNGALQRLENIDVQANGTTFTASFAGTDQADAYVVSTAEALYSPVLEAVRLKADLNLPAEYLIISHPDFINGLLPLVQARQAQGLTVSVVDVKDLYTQYTYGIFDPQAIKQYIAYAAQNLGTRYVLLVGGDTYDYRNYLGRNSISFIPSLYISTGPVAKFVPADPLYADLDADNVPDLAIGRFPVRTTAELNLMVSKTLAYAGKDYGRSAVFASDVFDGIVSFKDISNSLAAGLPAGWSVQNIHMDDMSVALARTQLLAAMNRGTALVTFTGHSEPVAWSFDNLFTNADAAALTNTGRPFVAVQWGCWNTYVVDPVNNYLVQKFLFSGDKGAAAVMGATTLTDSRSENMLGELLMPRMVRPGMTIGQALRDAKSELAKTHPELLDVLLGWGLMGDPALVIEP